MYIVVKRRTFEGGSNDKAKNKKLIFTNNAPSDHAYQKPITHL